MITQISSQIEVSPLIEKPTSRIWLSTRDYWRERYTTVQGKLAEYETKANKPKAAANNAEEVSELSCIP